MSNNNNMLNLKSWVGYRESSRSHD